MIPAFTVGQQVYINRPPPTLLKEDMKTSLQYIKLLSRTTRAFTVMDVKGHVITIIGNGIPNNKSIAESTHVPTKSHVTKKIIRKLCLPAQTTATRKRKPGYREPRECVGEKVVEHCHTSKHLLYEERWYGCSPKKDACVPSSHIPSNFINLYWNR